MLYTVYKTVNVINGKEYVGFHKIENLNSILYTESENGSIFSDGYMGSGKLMKRALQKYGPLNMRQSLLLVTEDKDEAEFYEREVVNEDWVNRDDTYNISLGGNTAILFGDNNGFFGEKHSKETIAKIQEKREETRQDRPFSWSRSISSSGKEFFNKKEICEFYNINEDDIGELLESGELEYSSSYLQEKALKSYQARLEWNSLSEERRILKSKKVSERFKGVPKSPESNVKRGMSIKNWIKENPDKHKERMDKINKNPEKIKKTALKHRGMKRSTETRKRISEANTGNIPSFKGKIFIHNIETGEKKSVEKNSEIPTGWARGYGKRK